MFTFKSVSKVYSVGGKIIRALSDVSLVVNSGEYVSVVGASGSGKSTLLNLMGALDRPTSGSVFVDSQDVSSMSSRLLAQFRATRIGFVFQAYHLIASLSAADNVALAGVYAGVPTHKRRERARALLDELRLGDRLDHLPHQLSGGQQQRVALARAMFHSDAAILADEPTGALDQENADALMEILENLHAGGRTLVLVTHDLCLSRRAKRTIVLSSGVTCTDGN